MLSIVGIGPGALDLLTGRAKERIAHADIVIGNERYISLIKEIIPERAEVIMSKMGNEVERARMAIDLSRGKNVVLVSGGDAGIYGMAGLVLEMVDHTVPETIDHTVELEIIPGITAASASAALLGAPLANDFAVVSLSDLLVPWAEIEEKLVSLAMTDIVVVIYNPSSRTRKSQIERAHQIFMKFRGDKTPVGIVRNAEREGCEVNITTLAELPRFFGSIDMSTTIVIGSSMTERLGRNGRWMVTRRGYNRKYSYDRNDGKRRAAEKGREKRAENGWAASSNASEAIWIRSKAIAEKIVSVCSFNNYERRVAERIVFANADPSLLRFLVFHLNPIERGAACIKARKPVVTDIEMVRSGIKYEHVKCFVNDTRAWELARRENITRTAAGIRLAENLMRDGIVVIGNSPSACIELSALVRRGVKPAIIVATPVGFVNAAEAKEEILRSDIPAVVVRGVRGGTPSAVAIINEIIEISREL